MVGEAEEREGRAGRSASGARKARPGARRARGLERGGYFPQQSLPHVRRENRTEGTRAAPAAVLLLFAEEEVARSLELDEDAIVSAAVGMVAEG